MDIHHFVNLLHIFIFSWKSSVNVFVVDSFAFLFTYYLVYVVS